MWRASRDIALRARILCIGNRYRADDDYGPQVFDRLCGISLPDGVELVDGGLAGIDLLRFFEYCPRVVVVDTVSGFTGTGEVVVLSADTVAALAEPQGGHAAGLPWLLRMLPQVLETPPPDIAIVGVEEGPALAPQVRARVLDRAADLSVRLAVGSLDWDGPNSRIGPVLVGEMA